MIQTRHFGDTCAGLIPPQRARVTDNSGGALVSGWDEAFFSAPFAAISRSGFEPSELGRTGRPEPPGERPHMLPLILILLLLAIVFGGFFVFSLKVAVVVAIVLLLASAFGGYGYRGRRTI
jgi:hypothetical protein